MGGKQLAVGKQLAAVSCVSCLSKKGWTGGGGGGGTVAGGKRVRCGMSLCRRFIRVFSFYRLLVENGWDAFSLMWG